MIATHGRGIWIIDDLTPLRALDRRRRWREAGGVPAGPAGAAAHAGAGRLGRGRRRLRRAEPAGGRGDHLLPARAAPLRPAQARGARRAGKVVDTLTPTKRRGINRVVWSMQVKPPRVPRAAQVAFSATQGPRVLPGTYTVRLTKGAEVDRDEARRSASTAARPTTRADRKAQFDAAMRAHALFGDMSDARRSHRRARARPSTRAPQALPDERRRSAGKLARAARQARRRARRRSSPPRRAARSPARSGSASTSTPLRRAHRLGGPARRSTRSSASTRSAASSPTSTRRSPRIVAKDVARARRRAQAAQARSRCPRSASSTHDGDLDAVALECLRPSGASCGGATRDAAERD